MRRVLLCTAFVLMGQHAQSATFPPAPAEPELARFYALARDEFRAASSEDYFSSRTVLTAWPCEVDEALLRVWAGVANSDEMDPRIQRAQKLLERDHGRGSRDRLQMKASDVRILPLRAQCLDGKLSGEIDYRVDYSLEARSRGFLLTNRNVSRVHVTMEAGELSAGQVLRTAVRTSGQSSQVLDPVTQSVLKTVPADHSTTLAVTVTSPDERGSSVSIFENMGITTVKMYLPSGKDRGLSRVFENGRLTSVSHLKAGLLHGLFETFEHRVAGVRIPASKACYEDGELLKVSACDVD